MKGNLAEAQHKTVISITSALSDHKNLIQGSACWFGI
jgi:hypothetical protein